MPRPSNYCQMTEITNYLYLAGVPAVTPEKLKRKRITCVINATVEQPNLYVPGIDYMKIAINDNILTQIDQYFDIVADKIKSVKERGGRVLVHCVAGVSRSATLCIIYLVKYENVTLRQAYYCIKAVRPIIKPNIGFWRQMVEYEKKYKGTSSVTMVQLSGSDISIPDIYYAELKKNSAPLFRSTRLHYIDQPTPLKFGTFRTTSSRSSHSVPTKRHVDRHFGYSAFAPPTSVFPLMAHLPSTALLHPTLSPAPTRRIGTSRLFSGLSLSGFREL